MNKTKVFSNANQIINGTFIRLQNYCLKSKDTLGVHVFAAVKHWLVPFVNLQHDVSLKKIVFFLSFPTGLRVSFCARGGGVASRAAISFFVVVWFCGRPLALFTGHYPSPARMMYVFSMTPSVFLDTGASGD